MAVDLQTLDQRVTPLELLVAKLRSQVVSTRDRGIDPNLWAVADEAGIEEVARLGGEFRRMGRVPDLPDD
jgi:hypothetical protein